MLAGVAGKKPSIFMVEAGMPALQEASGYL